MNHPMYYQATRCTGRAVFLHHTNGRVYHGTVVSVAPRGLYVMQHPPRTVLADYPREQTTPNGSPLTLSVESTNLSDPYVLDGISSDDEAIELTYAPVSYFAFGALAGLTLGAVAGRMWW